MKIESTQEPEKFEPVVITITIESADEFKHIQRIAAMDVTLPEAMYKGVYSRGNNAVYADEARNAMREFCKGLMNVLRMKP